MIGKRRLRPRLVAALIAAGAVVATTAARSDTALPLWPAGMVIAYKCADSLCLVRASGGGGRKLLATARPWPQWDPAFSPDGREVAFRGYWGSGDGAYALYVAPISGCRPATRLTRGIAGDPAWSPDGRWIAFDTSGYGNIYKVRPNGSGLTKLFSGRGVHEGWYPAWSPTGRSIAFVRDRRHGSEIWLMRADGSDKHRLYTDTAALDESLAWSHNGRWLAFDRTTTNYATIAVIRANGSKMHMLSHRPPAWNPVWLPGDTGVAYLAGIANSNGTIAGGRLYVMRSDGTGKHPVAGPRTIQFASTVATLGPPRCR